MKNRHARSVIIARSLAVLRKPRTDLGYTLYQIDDSIGLRSFLAKVPTRVCYHRVGDKRHMRRQARKIINSWKSGNISPTFQYSGTIHRVGMKYAIPGVLYAK